MAESSGPAPLSKVAPTTSLRSGVVDRTSRYGGQALVWAVTAFLVAVPVGAFLLQAFMPRLFDQGSAWFTLSNVSQALQGRTFVGLFNSLWVSVTVCALDLVIGGAVAWLSMRTNIGGRRIWPALMWALLLVPTWLMAAGWQDLLEPHGALSEYGLYSPLAHHTLFGPVGVVFVDALATAPYAYLTLSAALGGLGSQLEEAVRVQAVDNLPAQFGLAGILSLLLMASAAIPIAVQSRVTRGRSYAILSGRTRPATRYRLTRRTKWTLTSVVGGFFVLALGAPAVGAFAGSFVSNLGSPLGGQLLTLANYQEVFSGSIAYGHSVQEGATGLSAPVLLSTELAAITATVTVVIGLAVARLLAARRPGRLTRAGDLLLLGSIALPGASKLFGAKAALEELHLQVEPGSFVVLLGPSGSGKTTLLRCLAGIERLTAGTIAISGKLVAAPGVHLAPERRRLAMVFQDYALWPHMTAMRNVLFPLRQMRVSGPEGRRRAHEMLERVGLAHLSERYPNELSGGEQQRVALARALVGGVGLLLFDEPRLPGAVGAVVTATLPRPVPDGARLQLCVRPSAVHMVAPAEAHLQAQVRDVAFAGRGYEHALMADGPVLFTRIFSDRRSPRGTTVGVRLSPEGCLVLPADGQGCAPAEAGELVTHAYN